VRCRAPREGVDSLSTGQAPRKCCTSAGFRRRFGGRSRP
jgi:hypothetical protein